MTDSAATIYLKMLSENSSYVPKEVKAAFNINRLTGSIIPKQDYLTSLWYMISHWKNDPNKFNGQYVDMDSSGNIFYNGVAYTNQLSKYKQKLVPSHTKAQWDKLQDALGGQKELLAFLIDFVGLTKQEAKILLGLLEDPAKALKTAKYHDVDRLQYKLKHYFELAKAKM